MRTFSPLACLLLLANTGCGDDADGLTCDERVDESSEMTEVALNDHLSCQTTDDCTSVEVKTDCEGGCAVAVAKSGLTVVQEAVSKADKDYCGNFEEDGCDPKMVKCDAALVPTCDSNNQCVMALP